MSKESILRSIEIKKAEIARHRTSIASLRSRKSETNTRYSANIKKPEVDITCLPSFHVCS